MTLPKPRSLLDVPNNQRVPMDREATELLCKCVFADIEKVTEFTEEHARESGDLLMILWHRLVWGGAKVSLPVACFLGYFSKGLPGNVVMWAYTLTKMHRKWGKVITTKELAEDFPWGFPTEEGLMEIWDGQKGAAYDLPLDNLLDRKEVWDE